MKPIIPKVELLEVVCDTCGKVRKVESLMGIFQTCDKCLREIEATLKKKK